MNVRKTASKYCVALMMSSIGMSAAAHASVGQGQAEQQPGVEQEAQSPEQQLKRQTIRRVYAVNMAAIKVAQAVLERAENRVLREYARTLLRDHLQVTDALESLAQQSRVKLIQDVADERVEEIKQRVQDFIERIKQTPKGQFVQFVASQMSETHNQSIDLVQNAQVEIQDRVTQRRAEIIQLILQKHRRMAQQLNEM